MRTTLQGAAQDANKRVRKAIVRAIAKTCYSARTKGKTGGKRNAARIPYGMVAKLVDEQNKQKRDLGLTASMIHSVVRNMAKKKSEKSKSDPESDTDPESASDDDSESLKKKGKPGRPKGTTRNNITSKMKKEKDFINTVSSSYEQIRKLNPKKKLDPGQFNLLVADLKQEHAMPVDFEINFRSIRRRTSRGNPTSYGKGPNSPSQHLEAALVRTGAQRVNDFYDNLGGDESDSDSSEPSQKRIKLTGAARGAIVTFFTDAAIDIVSSRRTARGASSGEKRERVEQNPSLVATRWSTRQRQKKEGS